jgi:hypothetical protein
MRIIFALVFLLTSALSAQGQPATIKHDGQNIFASGINLAWMDFANDLDNFNEAKFTKAVKEIAAAKGNVVRWWIHLNGKNNPQFSNGVASGIAPKDLQNLKRALDIAYENGVLVDVCLWSFDMLQPNAGEENYERNKNLLTSRTHTEAYIKNVLTPMVKTLKGHPGIYCWEISNEPEGMIEGFGWTPVKIEMKYFQQFTNLLAGAIHRADPDTKVTNGSWNIRVLTDVDGNKNYYTNERLIEAGGDKKGYLDFYSVHFYTHFPDKGSPFTHPASYWKLDKPLVIAEFPAFGLKYKDNPEKNMTAEQVYDYTIKNGYAGAMSWTYTNHDGFGGLPDCSSALTKLYNEYKPFIEIKKPKK